MVRDWPKNVPTKNLFLILSTSVITAAPRNLKRKRVTISEKRNRTREIERISYSSEDDEDDEIYVPSSDDEVELVGKSQQDRLQLIAALMGSNSDDEMPEEETSKEMALAGLPTSFGKRPAENFPLKSNNRASDNEPKSKRQKKQKNAKCRNESEIFDASDFLEEEILENTSHVVFDAAHNEEWSQEQVLKKYWPQRYSLWSKYDDGIWMDTVGWFSVTPEAIAAHIASRIPADKPLVIWDPFGGLGGNAIQFAVHGHHVICSDIDSDRLAMARHNAKVYGVEDYIDFIHGNFFAVAAIKNPKFCPDIIFLSPPWGGPSYLRADSFDVRTMMDVDGQEVLDAALKLTENVIYFLPKNSSIGSIAGLFRQKERTRFEVEEHSLYGRLKAVSVYYGPLFHTLDEQ